MVLLQEESCLEERTEVRLVKNQSQEEPKDFPGFCGIKLVPVMVAGSFLGKTYQNILADEYVKQVRASN